MTHKKLRNSQRKERRRNEQRLHLLLDHMTTLPILCMFRLLRYSLRCTELQKALRLMFRDPGDNQEN